MYRKGIMKGLIRLSMRMQIFKCIRKNALVKLFIGDAFLCMQPVYKTIPKAV